MPETFFISDTHFGHKNILTYEPEARPFETIEEMHEVMISRWNNLVKPDDLVFHLGDFAFGKKNISIAERLNGKKRLVLGNHDTYPPTEYVPYFEKLYGVLCYNRCILSHIPIHPSNLGARWFLNIHGHLHSRKVMCDFVSWGHNGICHINGEAGRIEDLNYFNVSCEQNYLTPIHWDVIVERIKQLK